MPETNRIEYKQIYSRELDIEREVIAFLNYREGGVLYIGIDQNEHIIEVENIDAVLLKIKDRLKNNIRPSAMGLFDVVVEEKEGKNIVRVDVASGSEKPYYRKKYGMSERGVFIRSGSAAESMPQQMIDDLFSKRTRNSIGKIKSNRQDLTFQQLKIFYEEKGKVLNKNFASSLELITSEGYYNYAAYLLADENGNSIKFAKYKGTNRVNLVVNEEYGYESLIKATQKILDRLDVENITHTQITGKSRESFRLWHTQALREAVLNAFVHNDYTTEVPPKFEIFSDRLEITSAGRLPENMSREEFFEGISVPRNKELMRIYRDLGMVEQLGSGIPRILKYYNRNCFRFLPNFIRMTFPKKIKTHQSDDGGIIGGIKSGIIGGIKADLTDRQIEVLKFIHENNKVTITEIAKEMDINRSAVQKHIRVLKEKGVIIRIGSTRGKWSINTAFDL